MTKIQFEDLPSENTPVIANNLNQMQANIETAIDEIQSVSRIQLAGAVTGSADVPQGGVVDINTVQNNIVTVTGQITFNNSASANVNLNYPTGYDKDNCIPIGYKIKLSTATTQWSSGTTFDSHNMLGTMPLYIILNQNNITITARNILVRNADLPEDNALSTTYDIQVLLMKI